jgi:hypothetical protein
MNWKICLAKTKNQSHQKNLYYVLKTVFSSVDQPDSGLLIDFISQIGFRLHSSHTNYQFFIVVACLITPD